MPEIGPQPQDIVIYKQKPSAFFGTNMTSYLTLLGCDSVIVTGTTTSGCVRATVVDAFSAITSDRPYQAGRSVAWAIGELRRVSNSQTDPAVVDALERVLSSSPNAFTTLATASERLIS